MSDNLEEHNGKVSIAGSIITNMQFSDDTVALSEREQELENLFKYLEKTFTGDTC